MQSSTPVCPVPTEQQPLNEYQELRESWYFRWATLTLTDYLKPIMILWLLSWLVVAPVASVSFPVTKYPIQFGLSGSAGAAVIPMLALLRLWLGWAYIRGRLLSAEIFYEESGWYDGQTWTKPEEVWQRDRLIVTHQIQPIFKRLQRTFVAILGAFLVGILCWTLL